MASTANLLEQPILNASEIRELTGWPDIMIEDYLNIIGDLLVLANSGDNNAQSVLISLIFPAASVVDDEALIAWTTALEEHLSPKFSNPQSQTEYFSTAINFTTTGNEFVEVTSNVTVFLNAEPNEGEKVIVKRNTGAGSVTIDANGSTIDGAATLVQTTNFEPTTLIYFGQWFTA